MCASMGVLCLGNVLPVATCCHIHYHLHPFHSVLFKFKALVSKQHPTNKCVTTANPNLLCMQSALITSLMPRTPSMRKGSGDIP